MSAQASAALISSAAGLVGALIGLAGAQFTTRRTVAQAREQRRFERAQEIRAEVIPKFFLLLWGVRDAWVFILDITPTYYGIFKRIFTDSARELSELGLKPSGQGTELQNQQVDEVLEKWEKRVDEKMQEYERLQENYFAQTDKRFEELNEYFNLNRIWLPEDLTKAMGEYMDTLHALISKYNEQLTQWEQAISPTSQTKRRLKYTNENRPIFTEDSTWEDIIQIADKEVRAMLALDTYESVSRELRDWFAGEARRQEAAMWSAARKVLGVDE
jgi:hypothetical protein